MLEMVSNAKKHHLFLFVWWGVIWPVGQKSRLESYGPPMV